MEYFRLLPVQTVIGWYGLACSNFLNSFAFIFLRIPISDGKSNPPGIGSAEGAAQCCSVLWFFIVYCSSANCGEAIGAWKWFPLLG